MSLEVVGNEAFMNRLKNAPIVGRCRFCGGKIKRTFEGLVCVECGLVVR